MKLTKDGLEFGDSDKQSLEAFLSESGSQQFQVCLWISAGKRSHRRGRPVPEMCKTLDRLEPWRGGFHADERTICRRRTGGFSFSFSRAARRVLASRVPSLATRSAMCFTILTCSSLERRGNMSESNQPTIEIRDLHHAYKRQQALRGVSFAVEQGSIHGFVGPQRRGQNHHAENPGNTSQTAARHGPRLRPRCGCRLQRTCGGRPVSCRITSACIAR